MSETSEIVNDCLTHYEQRHIQVRWDFYRLCVYDPTKYNQKRNTKGKIIKDEPNQECMAKILRVVETLTDAKRLSWHVAVKNARDKGLTPPKEPKEWEIELTYGAIVELLYHTYGESTVRNSVACLIERGYLKRSQVGNNTIPLYSLNIPLVQSALKKLAEDALVGVESNSQSKKRKRVLKVTAKSLKSTASGVESNSLSPEFNTNNIYSNTKGNNTDKKEFVASATLPPVVAKEAQAEPLPIATTEPETPQDNKVTQGETHDTTHSSYPAHSAGNRQRGTLPLPAQEDTSPVQKQIALKAAVQVIPPLEQAAMVDLSPPVVDKSQINGDKSATKDTRAAANRERAEMTQKRIDAVYAALDTFKQEVMDDPSTKFQRTKIGNQKITDLLTLNPTAKKLRKVFYDMWNEKDGKTGEYFWRKHMSPQNVCTHYEARLIGLEGKDKKASPAPAQDTATNALIMSPTINGTRNLAYEMNEMEKKFLAGQARKRA